MSSMSKLRWKRSKIAKTMVAALAGGSLLGTCDTRVKDSVVQGSTQFLFSTVLNPTAVVQFLFPEDVADQTN